MSGTEESIIRKVNIKIMDYVEQMLWRLMQRKNADIIKPELLSGPGVLLSGGETVTQFGRPPRAP